MPSAFPFSTFYQQSYIWRTASLYASMLSEHDSFEIFGQSHETGTRQEARKRKRNQRDSTGDEAITAWTATRCMRLLRPIASRIEPLKRLSYARNVNDGDESRNSQQPRKEPIALAFGNKRTKSGTDGTDTAWMPIYQSRAPMKTYGGRQKFAKTADNATRGTAARSQNTEQPSDVLTLPTPFKARAVRHLERLSAKKPAARKAELEISSPTGVRQKKRNKPAEPAAGLARKGQRVKDQHWELQQGVSDGFSRLLDKTAPSQPASRQGARSLLSTCLRRVPEYIQLEEEWRAEVDEDDETDVAAEVYADLESLGPSEDHGWPPLREVVRAHAMSLIQEIIDRRLVSVVNREALATIAYGFKAFPEALELSVACARSIRIKSPPAAEARLFDTYLPNLYPVSMKAEWPIARFQVLMSLFNTGQTSLTWSATQHMVRVLSQAVRSVTTFSEDSSAALEFLSSVISLGCGKLPAATETKDENRADRLSVFDGTTGMQLSLRIAYTSLVTVLIAIVLCDGDAPDSTNRRKRSSDILAILQYTAIDILTRSTQSIVEKGTNESENAPAELPRSLATVVLTSNLLLSVKECCLGPEYATISPSTLVSSIEQHHYATSKAGKTSTPTEEIAALVCGLARCCGQGSAQESLDAMQDIVQSIIQHSMSEDGKTKLFLQQWALDSALHFAKTSDSRQAYVFARQIESAVQQRGPLLAVSPSSHERSKETPAKRKGFRWEEGLCEWIAATPYTQMTATKAPVEADEDVGISYAATAEARNDSPTCKDDDFHDSGYISELLETPHSKPGIAAPIDASPDILGPTPCPAVLKKTAVLVEKPQDISTGSPVQRRHRDIRSSQDPTPKVRKLKRTVSATNTHTDSQIANATLSAQARLPDIQPPRKARKIKRTAIATGAISASSVSSAQSSASVCASTPLPAPAAVPVIDPASGKAETEGEADELAMSVRKKRKAIAAPSLHRTSSFTTKASKGAAKRTAGESEDELGL
ncbi:hypothetical protein H2203_002213 [Taxawa tesnikishii (nom. ined.)]|nr:hypothetical protein H2203_002213 [Dothideales sp. JES 119]